MSQQSRISEELQHLRNLGVKIDDETNATNFLASVDVNRFFNYYRVANSNLNSDVVFFENIQDVYCFDNELKMFLWKWIAPIEIRTRKQFVNSISSAGDVLEYRNAALFKNADAHAKAMCIVDKEIKRAKENNVKFVCSNLAAYGDLPVFDVVEICSFGTLSKLCGNLKQDYIKLIAESFSLSNYCFTIWIRHLVAVRNICAHHNRFYGLSMRMSPKLLKKDSEYFTFKQFPTFIVLKRIYENIDDFACIDFLSELNTIVRKYRHVSLSPMGFPENWKQVLNN